MQTVFLDGSLYKSSTELHKAIQSMLSLPDHYGMNADALYDCLSERTKPVNLWIASRGTQEVSESISLITRVITDLGGSVKEL